MNPITALTARPALPGLVSPTEVAGQATSPRNNAPLPARDPVALSRDGQQLARRSDALGERVGRVGAATLDMAQSFLGDFATRLFGKEAEGMSLSFDSLSLSAESRFTAARQRSQGSEGISESGAMRLEDSASFIGSGTLTTADGRQFSFEIEVQYEFVAEAAYSRSSGGRSNGPASLAGLENRPAGPFSAPSRSTAAEAPFANGQTEPIMARFGGTAAELLQRLTTEDTRLPFRIDPPQYLESPKSLESLQGPESAAPTAPLLGELLLRLLDLPGGPRNVDLRPAPEGTTEAERPGRVDLKA